VTFHQQLLPSENWKAWPSWDSLHLQTSNIIPLQEFLFEYQIIRNNRRLQRKSSQCTVQDKDLHVYPTTSGAHNHLKTNLRFTYNMMTAYQSLQDGYDGPWNLIAVERSPKTHALGDPQKRTKHVVPSSSLLPPV